jgi:HEAT repeat protein
LSSTQTHQLITVLRESSYPEQREWAVQRLAGVNPQQAPHALQAVLRAARDDASPMVQVACIRTLVQMSRYSPDVAPALQALKTSGDPRVRLEADQALVRVGYLQPSPTTSVLPAAGGAYGTR